MAKSLASQPSTLELFVDPSVVGSQITEVVGRYVGGPGGACTVCPLSKTASQCLNISELPILITADLGIIREVLAIVQYLTSASPDSLTLAGSDNFQKAAIDQWLGFVAERGFKLTDDNSLHTLNSSLEPRTFATGHHITLADLVLFPVVHQWASQASQKERIANCNITRWFDHMQHLPGIKGVSCLPLVELEQTVSGAPTGQPPAEKTKEVNKDTHGGKGKKKPKEAKPKTQPQQKEDERPMDDPTRLEIRVGVIRKVWPHPDADGLFCEEIDIGEPEPRKIASGLRHMMTEEQMLNQKVLVLANLKARNLRGFSSHGMVLCASSVDKSKVEFVRPPPEVPIGELVFFEGVTGGSPDKVLTSKTGKDTFKEVAVSWVTSEEKIALFKTFCWMTSLGPCFCDTVVGGSIS